MHQQHQPPAQLASDSTSNSIEALFQNIAAPVSHQSPPQPQQPVQSTVQSTDNAHAVASVPPSPVTVMTDDSLAPGAPATVTTASDRQSALLSLLSGPASSSRPALQAANVPLPTQVPTPPGSSQRSNASPGHNETQGKILLEQLMAGYALNSVFL